MRTGQCVSRATRQNQYKASASGFVDITSLHIATFHNTNEVKSSSRSTKRGLKVRILPKKHSDSDAYRDYGSLEDGPFVFVSYAKYRLHGSFKAAIEALPITPDGLCTGNKMAFIHSKVREASRSFSNSRKFRRLKTARLRTIRETQQQGSPKSDPGPRTTSNNLEAQASCSSPVFDQDPSILPPLDPQLRLHTSACFPAG